MTYTPQIKGRILILNTESGTRYALVVNGRMCSPEFDYMTGAQMFALEYGVEVVE